MSKIFSGDYSRDMWDEINNAKTVEELRDALYLVCCRLQELESRVSKRIEAVPHEHIQTSVDYICATCRITVKAIP